MILSPLLFAAVLHSCAPLAKPGTMAAIASHESGFNPYAIHDNTTSRAYYPATRDQALEILADLPGHSLDVGVVQVNFASGAATPRTVRYFVCLPAAAGGDRMCGKGRVRSYRRYTLTAADALDSCRDAFAGMAILQGAWEQATADFSALPEQLAGAIALYNTGSSYAAPDYVRAVVEAAHERGVLEVAAYANALTLRDAQAARPRRLKTSERTPIHNVHTRNGYKRVNG